MSDDNKKFSKAMVVIIIAVAVSMVIVGYAQTYTGSNQYTSAINNGVAMGEKGARWVTPQDSTPAIGAQATTTKAAGGGTVRHIADCVTISAGSITAPALTAVSVNLRDGISGAGTVLWSVQIVISAATGQNTAPFSQCGLNKIGSANTAMTLEWSAGVANVSETADLTGFDVQ